MDTLDLKQALKAAAWERAKGELRSMVAIEGAVTGPRARPDPEDDQRFPHQILEERIEAFIKEMEDDEFNL